LEISKEIFKANHRELNFQYNFIYIILIFTFFYYSKGIQMNKDIKIAPSLLSANFANLEADIRKCEAGASDMLHIDVMDGHFVPNITIGPLVVSAINKVSEQVLDCHLMISEPEKYIDAFADAGADMISVHSECQNHLHRTLSQIKARGVKSGVALNPITPLEYAFEAAEYCDFILLMSVNPGFGGQSFIESFYKRCDKLANFLNKENLSNVEIQVDGGVKFDNAKSICDAGANILVCGSGVFAGDIAANIKKLRECAKG
jgi:ribulose-phosphate 3-epimerase